AVASVGSRAVVARCLPATIIPAAGAILMRCGWPSARAARRAAPAQVLDALVWQDLCRVLSDPALITHARERAQMGAWVPQALHARRQTLRDVLAQLERQQARRLDLYLAEVIEREECARRRKEVAQSQQG